MRRFARILSAAFVAGAIAFAVAALSRVPYAAGDEEGAILRLSWRFRGERLEECRRLSAEELAQLPAHMRREVVCEGGVAPFLLSATVDSVAVAHDTIRASGARADRPLYVFREVRVAPGEHRLQVRFHRLDRRDAGDRKPDGHGNHEEEGEGEQEERKLDSEEMAAGGEPAALALHTRFRAAPGEVVLVTYDPELRRLVLRGSTR